MLLDGGGVLSLLRLPQINPLVKGRLRAQRVGVMSDLPHALHRGQADGVIQFRVVGKQLQGLAHQRVVKLAQRHLVLDQEKSDLAIVGLRFQGDLELVQRVLELPKFELGKP